MLLKQVLDSWEGREGGDEELKVHAVKKNISALTSEMSARVGIVSPIASIFQTVLLFEHINFTTDMTNYKII